MRLAARSPAVFPSPPRALVEFERALAKPGRSRFEIQRRWNAQRDADFDDVAPARPPSLTHPDGHRHNRGTRLALEVDHAGCEIADRRMLPLPDFALGKNRHD